MSILHIFCRTFACLSKFLVLNRYVLPCVQLSYDMYLVFGGTENLLLKPLVVFAYIETATMRLRNEQSAAT